MINCFQVLLSISTCATTAWPHTSTGRAVQVESMKPLLKAPGTERLKLKYDKLLSNVVFLISACAATDRPDFDPDALYFVDFMIRHPGRAVQVEPRLTPG